MRRAVHVSAVAVQLLTRAPVRVGDVTDADLRASTGLFPAVGLLVAATGVCARAAFEGLLGATAATVVAVAAMVAFTGAFHEDGLADFADGLWGGWSPQQRLEIMRDSRIGTYGVLALVIAFALRVAFLTPLALGDFARTLAAGHVVGRGAGVGLAAVSPRASREGLGAKVIGPVGPVPLAVAGATTIATLGATAGRWFWAPLLVGVVVVLGTRRLAVRKLGGVTGDVLGAVNQLSELTTLATLAALSR